MAEGPLSVRNMVKVGEQLFFRLQTWTFNRDVVIIACTRDSVNKFAHRVVLEAASKYFAEHPYVMSITDEPIEVPCTGDVMDILLEYIYTSRRVGFNVDQALQLYSTAKMLCLDDLASQLERVLATQMEQCVNTEKFLVDDTFEDIITYLKIFKDELVFQYRVQLMKKIVQWAVTYSPPPGQFETLTNYITNRELVCTRSVEQEATPAETFAEAFRQRECLMLYNRSNNTMVEGINLPPSTHKSFQVKEGLVQRLQLKKYVSEQFYVIRDNDLFSLYASSIEAHDLLSGTKIKTVRKFHALSRTSYSFLLHKNRVYIHQGDSLHEITDNYELILISHFETPLTSVCVTKHTDTEFECLFTNWDGAFRMTRSGRTTSREQLKHSDVWVRESRIVGQYLDKIFVLQKDALKLCVLDKTTVLSEFQLDEHFMDLIALDDKIYVKHEESVKIIDTTNNSVSTTITNDNLTIDANCILIKRCFR